MTRRPLLAIVLAAGMGTRMKSGRPKVLHALGGRAMILHALEAAKGAGAARVALVIGPGMESVEAAARGVAPEIECYIQEDRLGTAHAVLAARPAIEGLEGDVLVLYGDTPLLRPETLRAVGEALSEGASLAVLGFEARDPSGYGRLITGADGALQAIREEKDADDAEKRLTFCSAGVLAFRGEDALDLLAGIGTDNAKGEYYLTEAVEVARREGRRIATVRCGEEEVLGVNSRVQLAQAEAVLQQRMRTRAMEEGATLIAPETVHFSADTKLGRDVVVEPNVVFGPGVTVEDGATIKAFSHLEQAHVGAGASVGPYARLRPGASIGADARVGNFVEIKEATLEEGAKVNHLAYIGDASVGKGANVGAGTITCNYDGFDKHRTEIGAGAFIGSNTALVAPVKIGGGAYIGSGSVITRDVPDDALALTRGPLDQRENWAARMRERRGKAKEKRRNST